MSINVKSLHAIRANHSTSANLSRLKQKKSGPNKSHTKHIERKIKKRVSGSLRLRKEITQPIEREKE